jgi:hypothetical protein
MNPALVVKATPGALHSVLLNRRSYTHDDGATAQILRGPPKAALPIRKWSRSNGHDKMIYISCDSRSWSKVNWFGLTRKKQMFTEHGTALSWSRN